MPLVAPAIPTILTKASWDKEKGVIAKMAGETGIGDAMKEVAAAYGSVDWSKFDAKEQCQAVKQMSVVDDAENASKKEYLTKVEKLREKVKALRDLAEKTEAAFKKKPLIPSSSTKHVGNVAKAADQYWIGLKDNGVYITASKATFKDVRDDLTKKQQVAASVIKRYISSIAKDGKDVIATPTVAQYKGDASKGFHQGIRGLSAALALQSTPAMKKFQGEWNHFVVDSYIPEDDKEVKPKVAAVLNKLKELQKLVDA